MLIDRFLEDATEVDVDAHRRLHRRRPDRRHHGTYRGSRRAFGRFQLRAAAYFARARKRSRPSKTYTEKLARALNVIGLMNVQYAVKDGKVYVLEVNPRASRTVPYVSKATGVPLPKIAVGVMLGKTIADFTDATGVLTVPQYFVKSPVFPFNKFPGVDPTLGPEMRSTGEVMGVGENFGEAFAKAQLSAGTPLPDKGRVFISVNDRDKPVAVALAKRFHELGFEVDRHARHRRSDPGRRSAMSKTVFKVNEGRPNAVDLLKAGSIDLIIYTATSGAHAFTDEKAIRKNAVTYRVPCITTMSGARASVEAIVSRRRDPVRVWSLQEIHGADVTAKAKTSKEREQQHERHRTGGGHRKPPVPAHQDHQQTSAADLRQADDLLSDPDPGGCRDQGHSAGHRRPQFRRFLAPARQRQGIRTQASELRLPGRRRRHRRCARAGRTLCRRRQNLRDPGR